MGTISLARLIIILAPVLVTISIGFLIGKMLKKTDISLGSWLAIYLFSPVMIIQTAMPTAFNTMLLTKELKGNYAKAASTVFLTTILSPITASIFLILVERFF